MAKKPAAIQPKAKQHAKKGGVKKGHGKGQGGKGQGGKGAGGQAGTWTFIPQGFAGAFGGNSKKHGNKGLQQAFAAAFGGNSKKHGNKGIPQAFAGAFGGNSKKHGKKGNGNKGNGKGQLNKKGMPAKETSKYMEKLANIDSSRKVWVGGLDKSTTWKQLEAHFKDVAKPAVTEIMKNGRACLAFKTDDEAQSAIASLNGSDLGGKTIEVDVWTQKEKKEHVDGEKKPRNKKNKAAKAVIQGKFAKNSAKKAGKKVRGDPKTKEKLAKVDNSLKVWVGNLKADTNAGHLRKHFAEAGCKPHLINLTGKDAACLSFRTVDEVQSAIGALSGSTMDDQVIQVDEWTKPERKEKSE